jgi:hypothetical protein
MVEEEVNEPEDSEESTTTFESSAKEAKRAQWALNLLVALSAVAGAVFFGYVLYTIKPFGGKTPAPVNVPTSAMGAKFGLLVGEDESSGVMVALKDIDEAPSYREKLSEVMRRDLGIERGGRLYLLVVRNDGKDPVSVDAQTLNVKDGDGKSWSARWLDQVANSDQAAATGRMRLAQSAHKFDLEKGEERQLYVFIPSGDGMPPSGEDFQDGELKLSDKLTIPLKHKEIKATAQ